MKMISFSTTSSPCTAATYLIALCSGKCIVKEIKIFTVFKESEGSLRSLKEPPAGFYPEAAKFSQHPIPLIIIILVLSSDHALFSQVVSSPQEFD
jgi:hypothetical protein